MAASDLNISLGFYFGRSLSVNSTVFPDATAWNAATWALPQQEKIDVSREEQVGLLSLFLTLIVLGLIILATIIGNVFVMAAVILERNLRNVANYLTASLAAADLLVAVLVMPLAAVDEVTSSWFLGKEVCDMWTSFDLICCTSSILHLVAISLDRYWAVTRVDYIHNRSARRMLFMIALSWGLSVVISIPPFFIPKDPNDNDPNDNDPNLTGECIISQDLGYQIFSTVGAFYLPFLLMMIIYLKVFRAARSSIRKKRFKEYVLRETPHLAATTTAVSSYAGSPVSHSPGDATTTTSSTIVILTVNATTGVSPEHSTVDDLTAVDGVNRNGRYLCVTSPTSPTPPSSPSLLIGQLAPPPQGGGSLRSSWLDLTRHSSSPIDRRKETSPRTRERRAREKIEQRRERKAARTLAIVTGSFIVCWLPFFIVALLRPFCQEFCNFPDLLLSVIIWLGYFNSLLNPVIYTVFNPDFRMAFRKILFGKYRRHKYRRATPVMANS